MESTPYYFYDLDLLERTLMAVEMNTVSVPYKVHYAIKANNNKKVLSLIASRGFGADCVSSQEIMWALDAGFKAEDIVFAGVGKTDAEIEFAVRREIGMLNCESLEEIIVVNEIAEQLNKNVRIALRLNPNVNALTHEKISTGLAENKFGLTTLEFEELIEVYSQLRNVEITGLHFHIGSQVLNMSAYEDLCHKINKIIPRFEAHFGELTYLNVGGGLGIDYENPDENPIPDFESYFNVFKNNLDIPADFPVHFELGRSIVGQCGRLRTRVLYIKRGAMKNFAVMDAGMTELLRPAMYGAAHQIAKMNYGIEEEKNVYDIVGPICESSDCFAQDVILPELKRGDVVEIKSCGAYAESMSLNYNGRGRIGSVPSNQVATSLRIVKSA
ncbi:MAG: diaminopimelate decarboxylase [Flavobacteriales bacterium]|nr:diaminopimelate decarboxylase [Flavobacteriales bacterium]